MYLFIKILYYPHLTLVFRLLYIHFEYSTSPHKFKWELYTLKLDYIFYVQILVIIKVCFEKEKKVMFKCIYCLFKTKSNEYCFVTNQILCKNVFLDSKFLYKINSVILRKEGISFNLEQKRNNVFSRHAKLPLMFFFKFNNI